MATRCKDSKLDILPESPGEHHLKITGSKLPTYNQVLLCYLAKVNELRLADSSKNTKLSYSAGTYVASEVLKHYEKAHIPTVIEKQVIKKIIQFHDNDYSKCMRIPRDRRNSSPQIVAFREKLNNTMPFFPSNVEDIMNENKRFKSEKERQKIDEDILFLQNMLSDRTFTYSCKDMTSAKLEERRREKEEKAHVRIEKERQRVNANVKENNDNATESEQSDDEYEPRKTPKRSHKRVVKAGTPALIPHDILKNTRVVETAVRNNITPTAAAELARSIISASGGNVDIYNVSQKYRAEAVSGISRKIIESWQPPDIASIHWDGKLMDTLTNEFSQEERLPILISGIGGV